MSDPAATAASVRPMQASDYADGNPLTTTAAVAHPTRDLIVAAVVGAAALWAVPRLLDYVTDQLAGGGGELELEEE